MVGLFPHIQERAQLELESVIGTERLPCVRDRKRLPYIEGLLKELYRWKPIGPLCKSITIASESAQWFTMHCNAGMPHSVMQEEEYMGYKIPKGATVVANTWYATFANSLFSHTSADRYQGNPTRPPIISKSP